MTLLRAMRDILVDHPILLLFLVTATGVSVMLFLAGTALIERGAWIPGSVLIVGGLGVHVASHRAGMRVLARGG